jgi:acetate kinase
MIGEILVLNAGSSSLKASLFEAGDSSGPRFRLGGQVEGIGTPHLHAQAHDDRRATILEERWPTGGAPEDHGRAIAYLVERLTADRPGWRPIAIGHRVLHGGFKHDAPIVITPEVRGELESLIPLGPLHQPANLRGIDAASLAYPGITQVACFDTAFHHGRPFEAEAYALPREYFDRGIRRYGFHGLSYEYITRELRRIDPNLARGRVIVAHLGNGASLCAVKDGKSVDTTMGLTPLDGLVMGTRPGQIDPGVLLHLLQEEGKTVAELSDLLWKRSGLLGLSGIGPDMRDLLASDSDSARQAVDVFVYRLTTSIGAMAAALGGVDGIVFTAGIGEHAGSIRARVCRNLAWLGLDLDEPANRSDVPLISTANSKVSARVVPTDEERMIAIHVAETLGL